MNQGNNKPMQSDRMDQRMKPMNGNGDAMRGKNGPAKENSWR
jgi:hypothetical protein